MTTRVCVDVQKWSLNVIILKKIRADYEPPNCDDVCVIKDKIKDVMSGVSKSVSPRHFTGRKLSKTPREL